MSQKDFGFYPSFYCFPFAIALCARLLVAHEPLGPVRDGTDQPLAIVGTWEAVDRHVAMGSLYQPVHGVRQREAVVTFQQAGDRLTGFAVCGHHHQISNQERWKGGRTEFRKVTIEDNRLTIEFAIDEWFKGSGPLAVEEGRLKNAGTIRVEAKLQDDRLAGIWKMLLADGSEVFRGEWEASRTKEATKP
jgi:hypothetical protein